MRSIDKQAGKFAYTRFAVSGMPSDRVGWRRVRHKRDRRDLNVGFARWHDPMKQNVGFQKNTVLLEGEADSTKSDGLLLPSNNYTGSM